MEAGGFLCLVPQKMVVDAIDVMLSGAMETLFMQSVYLFIDCFKRIEQTALPIGFVLLLLL